jgi:hypothetical protein
VEMARLLDKIERLVGAKPGDTIDT